MDTKAKERENGYYWVMKDFAWSIAEWFDNKWDDELNDCYWIEIDETQIVRHGEGKP
jgi:hypothetical protein